MVCRHRHWLRARRAQDGRRECDGKKYARVPCRTGTAARQTARVRERENESELETICSKVSRVDAAVFGEYDYRTGNCVRRVPEVHACPVVRLAAAAAAATAVCGPHSGHHSPAHIIIISILIFLVCTVDDAINLISLVQELSAITNKLFPRASARVLVPNYFGFICTTNGSGAC